MSIKIGVTGGIGSGKSMVCRLLQLMGVPVYISDTETKQLMAMDARIRSDLQALLGPEVYINGELNKPLLATYLFADVAHTCKVNAIVHPRVKDDFHRWVEQHTAAPLVAIESAILIEAGFADEVDVVVMVYAPLELRIRRAMSRDVTSQEAVEQRISTQMNDEEKRSKADFVIVNDDETPLIPQVLKLIGLLSKNIGYLCSPENH